MKKELVETLKWADETIQNSDNVNMVESCEHLNRWIAYFQHERLIHLIVTALFALLTIAGFIAISLTPTIPFCILALLLLVLTIAYIYHYYLLENTVQKLYHRMDKMIELKKGKIQ